MIVDLDVTRLCDRVHDLQREVENEPPVDDVSRADWNALLHASRDLFYLIRDKIEPGELRP